MDGSTKASSDRARLEETVRAARQEGDSRTGVIGSSPLLVRLASRLGVSVGTLAIRLPSETVRRTKYAAHEELKPDGSVIYRHPNDVIEGPRHR